MWKETNVFGVFVSPLVAYMVVAFMIYLPFRVMLAHTRLLRLVWNPPLAEVGVYVCILGALVLLL